MFCGSTPLEFCLWQIQEAAAAFSAVVIQSSFSCISKARPLPSVFCWFFYLWSRFVKKKSLCLERLLPRLLVSKLTPMAATHPEPPDIWTGRQIKYAYLMRRGRWLHPLVGWGNVRETKTETGSISSPVECAAKKGIHLYFNAALWKKTPCRTPSPAPPPFPLHPPPPPQVQSWLQPSMLGVPCCGLSSQVSLSMRLLCIWTSNRALFKQHLGSAGVPPTVSRAFLSFFVLSAMEIQQHADEKNYCNSCTLSMWLIPFFMSSIKNILCTYTANYKVLWCTLDPKCTVHGIQKGELKQRYMPSGKNWKCYQRKPPKPLSWKND